MGKNSPSGWTGRRDAGFGAIGKGYALERAAEFLREAGVASGFFTAGRARLMAWGIRRKEKAGRWRWNFRRAKARTTARNTRRRAVAG